MLAGVWHRRASVSPLVLLEWHPQSHPLTKLKRHDASCSPCPPLHNHTPPLRNNKQVPQRSRLLEANYLTSYVDRASERTKKGIKEEVLLEMKAAEQKTS